MVVATALVAGACSSQPAPASSEPASSAPASPEPAPIDWTGSYYHGDGLGVNLSLELGEDDFHATWRGCLGLYGEHHGRVVASGRHLELRYAPSEEEVDWPFPDALVVVPWDERLYLIAPDELPDFVEHVNAGGEPRTVVHGSYFLRRGDHERAATGFPTLPDSPELALTRGVVDAAIVNVRDIAPDDALKRKTIVRVIEVELDRGSRDELGVGTRLRLVGSGERTAVGRVTEVSERTSLARFDVHTWNDAPALAPGLRLERVSGP